MIAVRPVLASLVGKDEGEVLGGPVAGFAHGHWQGQLQRVNTLLMQLDE